MDDNQRWLMQTLWLKLYSKNPEALEKSYTDLCGGLNPILQIVWDGEKKDCNLVYLGNETTYTGPTKDG
jgi:hypothetical protein